MIIMIAGDEFLNEYNLWLDMQQDFFDIFAEEEQEEYLLFMWNLLYKKY